MVLTSCHNIPSDFISSQKIPKQEKRKKKERKKTELAEDEFLKRKRVLKTIYLGLRCPVK
jgi:hypothetical protein